MPTYVYRCTGGCEIEVDQSINDAPLEKCPVVTGEDGYRCECPTRRVIQRTFFKISGGGVYKPGFQ